MKKTRAAAAAIIGLALTATGVLAAAPHTQVPTNAAPVSALAQDETLVGGSNYNHGGAVSALVEAAEATEAPETPDTETPDAPKTDTTDPAGAQGAHGAAVSLVAQDKALVGGPNHNHGGAVSLVARGTHGAAATQATSATQPASTTHGKSTGKGKAGAHTASH